MLPLCLQLNELTLLLAIFFAFAALPACSRQAKPEITIEQLTPEQQARAKANREIADAKRRTMNARAARLKKAEEAGCTPGAARPRPRAGAGAPITDPFVRSVPALSGPDRWSSFFCSGSASSSSSSASE